MKIKKQDKKGKADKVNNFVKEVNKIKEENKLDLSTGEDLSIGIMNLISLEEHFMFSFMKTSEEKYLDFLNQVRELRKDLMKKIVPNNEKDYSENWCSSKHLLASSMRLIEVANKESGKNSDKKGKKENSQETEDLYYNAFNLYSLFWEINGFLDNENKENDTKTNKTTERKKENAKNKKLSKISNSLKKILDCCKE